MLGYAWLSILLNLLFIKIVVNAKRYSIQHNTKSRLFSLTANIPFNHFSLDVEKIIRLLR